MPQTAEELASNLLWLRDQGQIDSADAGHEIEAFAQERVDSATREQAALLRECAEAIAAMVPLLSHEFVCPEAAPSFSEEILDVLKRARALLSKLPAPEQEKKA